MVDVITETGGRCLFRNRVLGVLAAVVAFAEVTTAAYFLRTITFYGQRNDKTTRNLEPPHEV